MLARLLDTRNYKLPKSKNSIENMLANDLLDRLERLGLLDQEIVEALREQLGQSGTRVTPEAIAKLLVDNGQLTKFQATKLIGELRSGQYDDATGPASGESDLDMADGFGDDEVVVVDAIEETDVFSEPMEVGVVEAEPVTVDAVAVGDNDQPRAARPNANRVRPVKKDNVWDSFKIYGFLGILAFLCLSGYGLYFLLSKGSSDEFIKVANKLYDQQNYVEAEKMYTDFLEAYGQDDQYASLARTRIAMSKLYQFEQFSDPTTGLDEAKKLLPAVENEPGLDEERGNLAGLLVDIADNLSDAAGKAKETTEKQRLLGRLDEQIQLMENPIYMTSTMRTTLSGRLQAISENRARAQRDISRNLRLDESVAGMNKELDAKNTKAAYDIRIQLLREFPELHDDSRLVELVFKASDIQKTLVTAATKKPEITTEATADDAARSIVLTTRQGDRIPGLDSEQLYLRARGSVLAFACDDGRLLWRKFVGFGQDHAPVPLDGGDGVLLSNGKSLEVQRCDGTDGKIVWRALMGEPFAEPAASGSDIYVPSLSGQLTSLDAETGDVKWATQIPQSIDVAPGLESRTGVAYQPGDHSNLYVLNGRNGSCLESFYIGHEQGTIDVPPVALLSHIFVFENAGTDFVRVHVLRYDENGTKLKVAQPPFRMAGNVTIEPLVQERRVIVLTDRGAVAVYDIEPTAEREQVSVVAEQVASYDRPTPTQMAVGRSQMWITGTRIGRFELQISTGLVVRDWVKHEGDSFVGQPLVFDDALIHSRVLRGTTGIRVTAADPKTGAELWRTDVGVPVAMISQVPNEREFHAITSQAALFKLDGASISSGSTSGPIENPGGNGVAMRFANPIAIDATKRLLLNQESASELIIYDPSRTREKLRLLTMGISDGKSTGLGLVAGGGLMLPLQSGRVSLLNWQTGSMLGSPFQPASEPDAVIQWTEPLALADDPDQVVIGDSRKSLYRLRIGEQIRELAKVDLPEPFLGPTARVGNKMIAAASGPSADFLIGRDLATLEESSRMLLDGRVVWGPMAAGDVCLVQTDDSRIRAFDEAGKQRFEIEALQGLPIGKPLTIGNSTVLVGDSGWIMNLDLADGRMIGKSDIGQPLSATPLPVGTKLLVPGAEGVIYIEELPTTP